MYRVQYDMVKNEAIYIAGPECFDQLNAMRRYAESIGFKVTLPNDPLDMENEILNKRESGSNVENFDYPANLMFACTMKILEGKFENVIKEIAEDILNK